MQKNPASAALKELKKRVYNPKLNIKATRTSNAEENKLTKWDKPTQYNEDTPLEQSVRDMHILGAQAVALVRELVRELSEQNENGLMMNPKEFAGHVRALRELYDMGREALNIPKLAPLRFKAIAPKDWMEKLKTFDAHSSSVPKQIRATRESGVAQVMVETESGRG